MNVFRLVRLQIRHAGTHRTSLAVHAEKTAEELFRTTIQQDGGPKDDCEWAELRNSVIRSGKYYSNVNVDATILGLCNKFANIDTGRSYVQFLQRKTIPLTPATAGKYLKLFTLEKDQMHLDEAQCEEVLRIIKQIRSKHPILDGNTAENLIYALCLTQDWRNAFELLDQVKEFGTPSHSAFNNIAQAAFRNEEGTIAVEVLEDALNINRVPSTASLLSWIRFCRRYPDKLEPFLEFIQRHTLQIPESVATQLKSFLEQSGHTVLMSSVSRNKICSCCKTALEEISIESGEFQRLQKAFHEKVLIKDNIFIKSTPQEFNLFNRFLKSTGPFDVVIDGLNVAYSVGNNKPVNFLSGHVRVGHGDRLTFSDLQS